MLISVRNSLDLSSLARDGRSLRLVIE